MKNYELLTIFKPSLDSEELDKVVDKISEEVKSYKGSVSSVDKMGRKKLAYDVQGYRDGFFTTIIVSLPAEAVLDFKRSLNLNENVLRFMFMEEAKKAQSAAESLFGAGGNMDNVPTVKIENEQVGSLLLDILVAGKIIPSKAEGKRLVQQGGLSLNGEKVTDIKRTLNKEDFEDGVALIKRGKKNFNKIIIE